MKKIAILATCAMICGALATPATAGRFKPLDVSSPVAAKPALGGNTVHHPSANKPTVHDSKNITDGAAKGQANE